MADNISPELLQQLYQQYLSGNYGGTGGYSPSYVQSSGEDGGTPKQFLGYEDSSNYFAPSGQNMGKITYGDPWELAKAAAFLGSFAVGGSALGAAAGGAGGMFGAGAAGLADGAGGMALAEGAYPASITAGDAALGAGGAGFAGDATAAGYDPAFGATGATGGGTPGYLQGTSAGMTAPAGMGSTAGTAAAGSSLLGGSGSGLLGSGMSTNGLIGAGLNAAGGIAGAVGANSAAKTQAGAAQNAIDLQGRMFDKQVELQQPWHDAGVAGLNKLQYMLGLGQAPTTPDGDYGSLLRDFGKADFQADPGYQFRMDQGQQALERSAAARGGLLSGRAIKDTIAYGQGQGAQEYQNAFNRFQINRSNKLNPLQSLSGVGQSSANTMGNAAQNYGTNAGNLITSQGAVRAAGTMGGVNALSQGLGSAWNAYQSNDMMNRLFPNYG